MDGLLVVVGVGNLLLRDDGVGVRVVEELRELVEQDPDALPEGTRLIDGGTALADVAGELEGARGMVLVDAVAFGDPAGTVSVQPADDAVARGGPAHAIADLLGTARLMGSLPDDVSVVGVEVADIDFGTDCSRSVVLAIPVAVDAVRRELWRMHDQVEARGAPVGASGRTAGATTW
jgi:hydrogenase maturation protease